jgi:hypothetical protein
MEYIFLETEKYTTLFSIRSWFHRRAVLLNSGWQIRNFGKQMLIEELTQETGGTQG